MMRGGLSLRILVFPLFGWIMAGCQVERAPGPDCGLEVPDPTGVPVATDVPASFATLFDPQSETHPDVGRIRDATVLGDRVAAVDAENQRVTIFDLAGAIVAEQGGRGYEADDYINLTSIVSNRTSLITFDGFHNRLTVLDADGLILRTLQPDWNRPRYHSGVIAAATDDLALIEFRPNGYQGESEIPIRVRQDISLTVVDLHDGAVVHELRRPGIEEWSARIGRAHGGLPLLFGRRTFATVTAGGVWILDTDRPVLERVSTDGISCIVPVDHAPVQVDDRWIVRARDSVDLEIAEMQPGAIVFDDGSNFNLRMQDFRRQLFSHGLPARSTLPFGSGLRTASDGSLWLGEYGSPMDSLVSWTRLDPSSMRATARVRLEPGLRVLDITHERLLAIEVRDHWNRSLLIHDF